MGFFVKTRPGLGQRKTNPTPLMTTETNYHRQSSAPAPAPYHDLPSAREFIVQLGNIYLSAGLPLASAFEAAFADYRSFGLPCQCHS